MRTGCFIGGAKAACAWAWFVKWHILRVLKLDRPLFCELVLLGDMTNLNENRTALGEHVCEFEKLTVAKYSLCLVYLIRGLISGSTTFGY